MIPKFVDAHLKWAVLVLNDAQKNVKVEMEAVLRACHSPTNASLVRVTECVVRVHTVNELEGLDVHSYEVSGAGIWKRDDSSTEDYYTDSKTGKKAREVAPEPVWLQETVHLYNKSLNWVDPDTIERLWSLRGDANVSDQLHELIHSILHQSD